MDGNSHPQTVSSFSGVRKVSTKKQRSGLMQEELEKGRGYVVLYHDENGNLQINLPFDRTEAIPARARYVIQDFEAMLTTTGAQLNYLQPEKEKQEKECHAQIG